MSPKPVRGPIETLRFLVTAKTHPLPSTKYRETVCTAGITEAGEWVRLYPVALGEAAPFNDPPEYLPKLFL